MSAVRRPRFLAAAPAPGISAASFGASAPLRDPAFLSGDARRRAPAVDDAMNSAREAPPPPPPQAPPPAQPQPQPVACNHPPPPPPGLDPRVAMAVESLRQTSLHLADQARHDALEVGLMVARRILEHEIQTDPRHLMAFIRETLQRLGEAREVTVRLCPEDLDRLGALGDDPAAGVAHVKLEADASLSPGDLSVESEVGSVDHRLQDRIEAAGRLLREALADDDGANAA